MMTPADAQRLLLDHHHLRVGPATAAHALRAWQAGAPAPLIAADARTGVAVRRVVPAELAEELNHGGTEARRKEI
jgi:hypothetical protein